MIDSVPPKTSEAEALDVAQRTLDRVSKLEDLLVIGGATAISSACAVLCVQGHLSPWIGGGTVAFFGLGAWLRARR